VQIMRIVKEASERKNEILDVAERLFYERGYDNTSTNDILAEIGIARGTLYYHFKSKEDILDAMIERVLNKTISNAKKVALDESIPVFKRLTLTVIASNVDTKAGDVIIEQAHKPQNALMHFKIQEMFTNQLVPLYVKIINDGIKENLMYTEYPEDTIRMILSYANEAFDEKNKFDPIVSSRMIQAFITNTELLLNMKKGSLKEAMEPIFNR
ncbi:MAG: TetR/AcrR family transcriptional regulator, partial [Oscillospiraceae bacterium]